MSEHLEEEARQLTQKVLKELQAITDKVTELLTTEPADADEARDMYQASLVHAQSLSLTGRNVVNLSLGVLARKLNEEETNQNVK